MKNLIDPIGNRTPDLPACTAVPEPTELPCVVASLSPGFKSEIQYTRRSTINPVLL
jgi:hypothetical protein